MTADTTPPTLALENVQVRYPGGGLAVDSGSLVVNRGEIIVIVGPNGAGKTSLVRSIAGFLPHEGVTTSGSITLGTRQVRGLDPAKIARLGICFIPERDKVFRGLPIEDNLRLFAERRRDRTGLEADTEFVFEVFPWIKDRLKALAGYLSGGEQQMLALSGVILARPDVLIVDEPSLGLAPVIVQEVMRRLRDLRDEFGLSVLLVDQNVRATVPVADTVYSMHAGVIAVEDREEILHRSATTGYVRSDRRAGA
jgi:branched-chain amino acid transport system ATP-binding protein